MHVTKWDAESWTMSLDACRAAWALRQPEARRLTQELLARAAAEHRRQAKADEEGSGARYAKEFCATVADLLTQHARTNLLPDERGATPRTAIRPGQFSPIQRLHMQGVLTRDHVRAASAIRRIVEHIAVAGTVRKGQLERGTNPSPGVIPAQYAEEWSLRYVPWSQEQLDLQAGGLRHLGLTVDVVVWETGFREACARNRIGRHRGYQLLELSLDDWLQWSERDAQTIAVYRAHAMARGRALLAQIRGAL